MTILTKEDFEKFAFEQTCSDCVFNKYCSDRNNKSICDIINEYVTEDFEEEIH